MRDGGAIKTGPVAMLLMSTQRNYQETIFPGLRPRLEVALRSYLSQATFNETDLSL